MKPLTIELVKGQKREFTFLGWKDDGLTFYATSADGQPTVIVPVSPYPHDYDSGEPYRFPRIVPLEITPKRFDIAWTARHLEVLRRWRDAKLAEVDAMSEEELDRYVFHLNLDLRLSRTRAELKQPLPDNTKQVRQDFRNKVERHYQELTQTPLAELLDPILCAGMLEDFSRGRWADEMGEDFLAMMREAALFALQWDLAYRGPGHNISYQEMSSALRRVRFVMRGDDGKESPLWRVELRMPTDLEAQAYVVMRQLVQGASAPRQGKRGQAAIRKATTDNGIRPGGSADLSAEHGGKLKSSARFENDFSLAVIPRLGAPRLLTIEPELRTLLKRIIEAGGKIPRTGLRKDKTDTSQPEKLLRSKTASALLRARLLGSQRNGRTTVFWAKVQAD